MRKGHPIVQSLQLGNHMCVYVQWNQSSVWTIFVLEGSICDVYVEDEGIEDEHLIVAVIKLKTINRFCHEIREASFDRSFDPSMVSQMFHFLSPFNLSKEVISV